MKTKRILFFLLIFSLGLSDCQAAVPEEPQPVGFRSEPDSTYGNVHPQVLKRVGES